MEQQGNQCDIENNTEEKNEEQCKKAKKLCYFLYSIHSSQALFSAAKIINKRYKKNSFYLKGNLGNKKTSYICLRKQKGHKNEDFQD